MIKKLLPILLILIVTGAGLGAGLFLKPAPKEDELANPCGPDVNANDHADDKNKSDGHSDQPDHVSYEYLKLNNQFIVPVIRDENVSSMVVVALSLEVKTGTKEALYAREPKIRDAFLQALFDHASIGGFDGAFATTENLLRLRRSLLEMAKRTVGDDVNDVLVTDIARQDM